MQKFSVLWVGVILLFGSGCASLLPSLEKPAVQVESLQLLESTGVSQRLQIGLRISNPNSRSLPIKGMSYRMSLNGFDLVRGVTDSVPEIAPYSETLILLNASTDLVSTVRLMNNLLNTRTDKLEYRLSAKIDLKGFAMPLNIVESGNVALGSLE